MTDDSSDKKPKKLQRKGGRKIEQNKEVSLNFEEFLNQEIPQSEGPKEISVYPPMECQMENCTHQAVGKDIYCRAHGGDSLIRENLMSASEIPDIILAKSKYDPVKHPINFITYSKEGLSEVEIAARFEVSVNTLRGWSEKFLEFNAAYEIGSALYEAWWLQEGRNNLDNRGYNVSLFKFLTGNKLGYSDKMESKNLNISAGVLMVPQQMEPDEWEARGKDFMENRDK